MKEEEEYIWPHFVNLEKLEGSLPSEDNSYRLLTRRQGDWIGRLFAYWVIVYFG
jgi:hypothetical protein